MEHRVRVNTKFRLIMLPIVIINRAVQHQLDVIHRSEPI